ncbi:MAG: hypothetical protein K6T65_04560 [Peptococcaceae bacterium]|nr:hypothetical protein [Peptococcaceae bacterium]
MPRRNVLIIDYNTMQRNNLKLLLWKLGCSVYESDNDVNAEVVLKDKKPELIFLSVDCDKGSPGLFQKIKEMYNCTVIVYSNRITRTDIIKYASADEILVDPCSQFERLKLYLSKSAREIRKYFVYNSLNQSQRIYCVQ